MTGSRLQINDKISMGTAVLDPDLEIRWGGGSSRPLEKGGRSPQIFFQPFAPQFGLEIRGGGLLGPSPGSVTAM